MKNVIRGIGHALGIVGAVYALGIVGSCERGFIDVSEMFAGEAKAALIFFAGVAIAKMSRFSLARFMEAYRK